MANFILMPQMGVSDESAVLSQWLVKEGDKVELEQPLFSMETGKSSFEELAKQSGIVRKKLTPSGEDVKVGTPVAIMEII